MDREGNVVDVVLHLTAHAYEDSAGGLWLALWQRIIPLSKLGVDATLDSTPSKAMREAVIHAFLKVRQKRFEEPPMIKSWYGGLLHGH